MMSTINPTQVADQETEEEGDRRAIPLQTADLEDERLERPDQEDRERSIAERGGGRDGESNGVDGEPGELIPKPEQQGREHGSDPQVGDARPIRGEGTLLNPSGGHIGNPEPVLTARARKADGSEIEASRRVIAFIDDVGTDGEGAHHASDDRRRAQRTTGLSVHSRPQARDVGEHCYRETPCVAEPGEGQR